VSGKVRFLAVTIVQPCKLHRCTIDTVLFSRPPHVMEPRRAGRES
jgi:hypothetical protein